MSTKTISSAGVFQSTLPQGERRAQNRMLLVGKMISIHAPARGATHTENYGLCFPEISIHAPARGATAILAKNFSHFLFTFPNSSPILHFNYHCFMAIPFDPPFFHTLLCTFSGANLPGFLCELQVRTRIFLTESRLSAFSPVISDRDTFRFSNRSLTATVSMLTS